MTLGDDYHHGGKPERAAHWLTNLSLRKAGFVMQDLSRTSRYLGITYDKPTARTATVSVSTYARTKLYTKVISCISDVCKCRLCWWPFNTWSDLNHRRDRICTACGQPAVGSKLPCVLQLQSSQLQVTDAALWPSGQASHIKLDLRNIKI